MGFRPTVLSTSRQISSDAKIDPPPELTRRTIALTRPFSRALRRARLIDADPITSPLNSSLRSAPYSIAPSEKTTAICAGSAQPWRA